MKYFNIARLFCCLMILPFGTFAQKLSSEEQARFKKTEDALLVTVDSMNRIAVLDERIEYCHLFVKKLGQLLKEPNSFNYAFDSLSKKVHILYPEDRSFRIFNWPVEYAPARFRYYGAIQKADGTMIPLVDNADKTEEKDLLGTLDNRTWFGQEYYRILTQKDAAGQPAYFLFGVNHNRINTSVKMIDVLTLQGNKALFGGNFFEKGMKRFVMEYQKGAQVSLNYDAEKSMVVYNVLESEINQPQRKHTMVASGELDGLKWNNGQWQTVRNLLPILKLKDGQAPINGVIPGN